MSDGQPILNIEATWTPIVPAAKAGVVEPTDCCDTADCIERPDFVAVCYVSGPPETVELFAQKGTSRVLKIAKWCRKHTPWPPEIQAQLDSAFIDGAAREILRRRP